MRDRGGNNNKLKIAPAAATAAESWLSHFESYPSLIQYQCRFRKVLLKDQRPGSDTYNLYCKFYSLSNLCINYETIHIYIY